MCLKEERGGDQSSLFSWDPYPFHDSLLNLINAKCLSSAINVVHGSGGTIINPITSQLTLL